MIKIVYAWQDRPDVGAEACERHYRQVHMPLAREAFDGVDGFVALRYNRVVEARVNDYNQPESRPVEPEVDAWIELYFESEEQLGAAFDNPVLARMFEDHENFMATDVPANIRIYRVEEETVLSR